jgi:hypothetical protein
MEEKQMSECEELVKRLRAKKKAAGFKSGLSEDGGHRVAEMQYVPDPDAQEAATLIAALAAEKEALKMYRDAVVRTLCAWQETAHFQINRAEDAEARVREVEAALHQLVEAIEARKEVRAVDTALVRQAAYARAALARGEGKG